MAKPATLDGYADRYTVDCERLLVTLLRGLGPWKESVFLVGGLTPRYLVAARPPAVPAHAGTLDLDIVIDLQILADTDAYNTLEDNLRRMNFEPFTNNNGRKVYWRWQTRTEHGALMVLELLADAPEIAGGRVQPLPTEGTISALNIPHSSMVFELHQVTEIQAELLDGAGVAVERVTHADLVSFTLRQALQSSAASEFRSDEKRHRLPCQCGRIWLRKRLERSVSGWAKNRSGGADSTILPASMKTISSATVLAKPIS